MKRLIVPLLLITVLAVFASGCCKKEVIQSPSYVINLTRACAVADIDGNSIEGLQPGNGDPVVFINTNSHEVTVSFGNSGVFGTGSITIAANGFQVLEVEGVEGDQTSFSLTPCEGPGGGPDLGIGGGG